MIGGAAQPFWAGLATFFRARAGGLEDIRTGDPVVVGAPFDGGVTLGRQGSKHGPRSIREASCYLASIEAALPDGKLYNVDTGTVRSRYSTDRLLDVGDADCYQLDPLATYESVKASVREIARRGGIPALLGGDHYLCFPGCAGMVEGIRQRGGATDCAYIHVDSHTDFWDEYGYGGKHNHATSVRRLWESGLVAAHQILWLGLNGTMPLEHYECIRREGMHFVTAEQLMESNWESTVAQALTRIAGAEAVYISLDIDVLNGAEAPGTGAAVFEGITAKRLLALLRVLAESVPLAGVDVCEVAAVYDPAARTERLAASALLTLLAPRLLPADAAPHGNPDAVVQ